MGRMIMAYDREELIRQRAYRIWQEEGEPEGRAHDHWSRAEQEHAPAASEEDALLPGTAADLPFGEPADTGVEDRAVAAPASTSPASTEPAPSRKLRRGKGLIKAVT